MKTVIAKFAIMDKIDILMKEIEQRITQLESDKLIDSSKKAILIRENKRFLVRCQQMNPMPYRLKNRCFFRNDDADCYKLEAQYDHMREHGIEEMDIYLAEREINAPYFFCREFGEVGEKGQGTCGRHCEAYQPRNGRSGVCKHYGYVYQQTEVKFTIKQQTK